MADDHDTPHTPDTGEAAQPPADAPPPAKKTAAKKATTKKAVAKKATSTAKKTPAKKSAKAVTGSATEDESREPESPEAAQSTKPARKSPTKKTSQKPAEKTDDDEAPVAQKTTRRTTKKSAPAVEAAESPDEESSEAGSATAVLFQAPEPTAPSRSRRRPQASSDAEPAPQDPSGESPAESEQDAGDSGDAGESDDGSGEGDGAPRRRRRRGGRRRRKGGGGNGSTSESGDSDSGGEKRGESADPKSANGSEEEESADGTARRRRRRRREGDDGPGSGDDPQNTVTRVRKSRSAEDEITAVSGSTRLEAKKQRRREGREAGRRRAPIVSEAEFLARREAVDRTMVIRQRGDLTQIGVLEDKVLVEHYVARDSQASMIGNVYLGRVQNVLPSMEAAFIDIGKGRNAVLYAGEVNWSALGHKEGSPRKIESVLTSGQSVLVQVTKDPVGHKGARLTSQISLAGRFLVYVPDGTTSGISRKLPDTERQRLKTLLKQIVPDSAGVIVRTAAEGASEEELTRDVERLKARWEDIEAKAGGKAPQLLYGEPDLTLKVVRDLFTEDFAKLVIQGDDAWETVQSYVVHVAPDLEDRLEKYDDPRTDIFVAHRVEEQIAKALDRKVWLPSGGSLIIDRTEAMTVIDVNTGKFTGSGGNLEETVTKNNLEAAEEVVRQLRLRDIGGIIVVDFIDMVLESNRDLVLRRMVECLGRDRTRHQVAEVTSLGLVQMTRKRIGVGLVESFSHPCEHCQGRGVVIQDAPVEPKGAEEDRGRSSRRRAGSSGGGNQGSGRGSGGQATKPVPSPKDVAAMAKPPAEETPSQEEPEDTTPPDLPAEPAPAEEPATPEVTTRTRARRSAGRPAAAPKSEPDLDPAPAPAPEATPTAEPAPPKVVTRARRSANRPAGTPTTAPEPVVVTAEASRPADADGVPEPVPAAEPPKVVTRPRGRRATRPAGPPSGSQGAAPEPAE